MQPAAAENLPAKRGRLPCDRASLATASVDEALLIRTNLQWTRLQLLVISGAQASVTQWVQNMGVLGSVEALTAATFGSSIRVILHAHKHRIACSDIPAIHFLDVASMIRLVLRRDRGAKLWRTSGGILII